MNHYINKIMILLALVLCCACDDYLDVKPSKSTSLVIETGDQLKALLNSYTVYYLEQSPWLIDASDDQRCSTEWFDITGSANCEGYTTEALSYTLWDVNLIPQLTDENWKNEYLKIFYANTILEKADKVSGLTSQERESIKQEARFIRAVSCWYLAQVYCVPLVSGNENKQGIVLKTSTDFGESVKRATLKETYNFIEADLQEALKIETPFTKIGSTNRWNSVRANKAAVNGFAARFYLYLNNYEKALSYANTALAAHSELVDYNTEMKYMDTPTTVNIDGKDEVILFPYTYEASANKVNEYMFEWKELTYFRMQYDNNWWMMPSEELMALYDTQYDLRYKYHYVQNFSYINNITTPLPAYIFFWKDRIPSGPTTAEMLLIKAECEARLGNTSAAMTAVNKLRAARMDNTAPQNVINLTASSTEDAVKKILEERRREMPFVRRFQDIRRLNSNDVAYDDVGTLTKSFYSFSMTTIDKTQKKTYTLEQNSDRYACPLPETEFEVSDFVIDQNLYQ